jgi:hypothetical protein
MLWIPAFAGMTRVFRVPQSHSMRSRVEPGMTQEEDPGMTQEEDPGMTQEEDGFPPARE